MKKITILFLLIALGGGALRAAVPQTQTILKGYFVSNAIPTQAQYAELIDTMFWYANQTYTNTLLALATQQQILASFRGSATFALPGGGGANWFTNAPPIMASNNIYSIRVYSGNNSPVTTASIAVQFTTPAPDTNHSVYFAANNTTNMVYSPIFSNTVNDRAPGDV